MISESTWKSSYKIQILKQNDEYALIKSNTTYGLSTYDYIVLDVSSVDVDQLINE